MASNSSKPSKGSMGSKPTPPKGGPMSNVDKNVKKHELSDPEEHPAKRQAMLTKGGSDDPPGSPDNADLSAASAPHLPGPFVGQAAHPSLTAPSPYPAAVPSQPLAAPGLPPAHFVSADILDILNSLGLQGDAAQVGGLKESDFEGSKEFQGLSLKQKLAFRTFWHTQQETSASSSLTPDSINNRPENALAAVEDWFARRGLTIRKDSRKGARPNHEPWAQHFLVSQDFKKDPTALAHFYETSLSLTYNRSKVYQKVIKYLRGKLFVGASDRRGFLSTLGGAGAGKTHFLEYLVYKLEEDRADLGLDSLVILFVSFNNATSGYPDLPGLIARIAFWYFCDEGAADHWPTFATLWTQFAPGLKLDTLFALMAHDQRQRGNQQPAFLLLLDEVAKANEKDYGQAMMVDVRRILRSELPCFLVATALERATFNEGSEDPPPATPSMTPIHWVALPALHDAGLVDNVLQHFKVKGTSKEPSVKLLLAWTNGHPRWVEGLLVSVRLDAFGTMLSTAAGFLSNNVGVERPLWASLLAYIRPALLSKSINLDAKPARNLMKVSLLLNKPADLQLGIPEVSLLALKALDLKFGNRKGDLEALTTEFQPQDLYLKALDPESGEKKRKVEALQVEDWHRTLCSLAPLSQYGSEPGGKAFELLCAQFSLVRLVLHQFEKDTVLLSDLYPNAFILQNGDVHLANLAFQTPRDLPTSRLDTVEFPQTKDAFGQLCSQPYGLPLLPKADNNPGFDFIVKLQTPEGGNVLLLVECKWSAEDSQTKDGRDVLDDKLRLVSEHWSFLWDPANPLNLKPSDVHFIWMPNRNQTGSFWTRDKIKKQVQPSPAALGFPGPVYGFDRDGLLTWFGPTLRHLAAFHLAWDAAHL